MRDTTKPFGEKKFQTIEGHRMAYIDEGEGDPIVFAHGNPTSSYLWRNVMPACRGLGRLIACDMIGMGDSGKLPGSGPNRYTYAEHRHYLFALWEELALGNKVVFVLHDWGSALGFEWACRHSERVEGIAFMEAFVLPLEWEDFSVPGRELFGALRSPAGEDMVLDRNIFVEQLLPAGVTRPLLDAEMAEYRRPYLNPGEDRRPTLTWPRQIPIEGEPADVVQVIGQYGPWLAQSRIPKLYVHTVPGEVDKGRRRAFVQSWPNQKEVEVKGGHFVQEDSPAELGAVISDFVREVRQLSAASKT